MPLKHTEPQQNPQHSTATAEPGYAVTHTRGISESSDLPADAITASSRVQTYLRDKRGWMNFIVVAHMQFFCCMLSVAFVNSYGWIPLVSALCSTTALYFRYRFPYGSIYVIIAALCLTLVEPFPDSLAITCYPPVSLAAYHIGRHWRRRARFRGLILGWVGALTVTVQASLSLLYHWDDLPARIFVSMMLGVLCGSIFTVFWFLGDSRRMRELRSEEFKERARRLEYEQEQERRLAAQDERTRIAREMHDIVAHNLSAVIALADGARYTNPTNPEVGTEALETIAATSRSALKQMRGLLSVLRDNEGRDADAVFNIAAIRGLLYDARHAGLDVHTSGIDTLPDDLPQLIQTTLYRIIQELLTNMLKYSPGQRGQLTVETTEKHVTITATNRLPEHRPDPGYGIQGMRERATALGGATQVRTDNNEFLVKVEIPR